MKRFSRSTDLIPATPSATPCARQAAATDSTASLEMFILILAVDAHFGRQIAGAEQDHVDAVHSRDGVARPRPPPVSRS